MWLSITTSNCPPSQFCRRNFSHAIFIYLYALLFLHLLLLQYSLFSADWKHIRLLNGLLREKRVTSSNFLTYSAPSRDKKISYSVFKHHSEIKLHYMLIKEPIAKLSCVSCLPFTPNVLMITSLLISPSKTLRGIQWASIIAQWKIYNRNPKLLLHYYLFVDRALRRPKSIFIKPLSECCSPRGPNDSFFSC